MGVFRRSIQIIWALLTLLTLLIVASLVYPMPYVTPYVRHNIVGNIDVQMIILVILATVFLYFLFLFFYACFAPSKRSRLDLKTERGILRIQSQAVESVVLMALDSINGVYEPEVTVKLYKQAEDTKVDALIHVVEERDMKNIGKLAQLKISESLQNTLGFKPSESNVKIKYADISKKKESKKNKKAPRVR